jgi:hypothetical protein
MTERRTGMLGGRRAIKLLRTGVFGPRNHREIRREPRTWTGGLGGTAEVKTKGRLIARAGDKKGASFDMRVIEGIGWRSPVTHG